MGICFSTRLANGASAAIVSDETTHPHIRVEDTFQHKLNALGRAARNRVDAKIVGVTGSAGKTGTKEALYAALRSLARFRASLGQKLQQPCRRSAQPVADGARCAIWRVENGDEPSRRIERVDTAGPPACRYRHDNRTRAYRFFQRMKPRLLQLRQKFSKG